MTNIPYVISSLSKKSAYLTNLNSLNSFNQGIFLSKILHP